MHIHYIANGHIELQYELEYSTRVVLSEAYFPYWKAYVDDREIEVSVDESTKLLLLNLSKGKHRLVLKFVDSFISLRYLCMLLTLFICAYVSFSHFKSKFYKRSKEE